MNTPDFKRKLTAVFSADVAGYSRLMGENEAATVKTLESYKQIMFSLIKQHRGRVIDSPGDNLLAEFASVVDAVQCGVAVQKELQARNAELPENRKMQFRIGINLGDVIEEQERIYGDGVNIAARLESCADPGGICVSKTAFDHIETKLPLGYEYLGEKEVKNIAKPVGAYRVLMEPRVTVAGVKERKPPVPARRRKGVLAGAVAVLILIIGVAVWNFYWRAPKIEPASKEKMAYPLPDKPSIVVLPFINMSDDKEQEYFADGLAEEIINGLTKVEHVFVIARHSSFTYKGKSVKVKQVAEEMGVRYVLEGSVRKTGEKVRITTQLVDALTGRYIFSESYDRNFKDILSVQGEITMSILTALQVSLTKGETARLVGKGTKNLEAYLKVLNAMQHAQRFNKEGTTLARRYAEEAIALDPGYAMGYLALSQAIVFETVIGANKLPKAEAWQQALEQAEKAVALDPCSTTISHLSVIYNFIQKQEKALEEAEKAVALGPNDPYAYDCMGAALLYSGRAHDAIPMFQKAPRLSPIPRSASLLMRLGAAYRMDGQNEEAIAAYKKLLQLYPDNVIGLAMLTASYVTAGHDPEARAQASELLRVDPNFSVQRLVQSWALGSKYVDQVVADLNKAGLK